MNSYKGPLVALCAIATFVALEIFGKDETLVLVAVVTVGILMLLANWSIEHLIVYVAFIAIGVTTELISVHVGLWSYPTTHAFGFPLWIPFIWSNGALFVVELKEWVDGAVQKLKA